MPTMVEFSGAIYPTKLEGNSIPPMRGVSLTPTLKNKPLNRGKPLFWQYAKGSALRDGKWKLVRSGKDWELYDMSNDRTETSDLAASNPERVKRMGAAWDTWYRGCTGNDFKLPVKKKKTKKSRKKGATGK